jgi:excisionase family DNA binding protein
MAQIMNSPCFVAEAARVLGVAESTVRAWSDAGRLDVQRTAAGIRIFDREALKKFAAERADKK